jgi:hypothetical protein
MGPAATKNLSLNSSVSSISAFKPCRTVRRFRLLLRNLRKPQTTRISSQARSRLEDFGILRVLASAWSAHKDALCVSREPYGETRAALANHIQIAAHLLGEQLNQLESHRIHMFPGDVCWKPNTIVADF